MRPIVLVTGATGRSGRHFLQQLSSAPQAEEFRWRMTARPTSDATVISGSGLVIETVVGDLGDTEFLEKALLGVDTILHIAGIQRSLPIVETALRTGVKRIILVHTTGIYSKYKAASSEYLEIERKVREMLTGTSTQCTILRPTMVYGSLDDNNISVFLRMVDRVRLFPVVDGGRFNLQPVHHQDLGQAYLSVLMNPVATKNKDYILSGKYPIDLVDILSLVSTYLGKRTLFFSIPFRLAYVCAVVLHLATLGRVDLRERVQRLVEPRAFSHAEATSDFGYSPIDFKDGLRTEVDAYTASRGR
jgi:uncharacterized protein YbjT (DUF2867 family)